MITLTTLLYLLSPTPFKVGFKQNCLCISEVNYLTALFNSYFKLRKVLSDDIPVEKRENLVSVLTRFQVKMLKL